MEKDFKEVMFQHEMRILKQNAETVTITLNRYEDMITDIQSLRKERNELAEDLSKILENNENYELSDNFYYIAFLDRKFVLKKGVNNEIDQLKDVVSKLTNDIQKSQTFWYKLKNLFK